MSFQHWLLGGLVGTLVLTLIMAGSQGFGYTRMNLPYMLGSMFTPSRDHAKVYGFVIHLINGLVFSLLYLAIFHLLGTASIWLGSLIGLVHALLVLTVAMPMLPGVHPRMAGTHRGPTVVRQLEPPGFLARNYGPRTGWFLLVAHVLFGALLSVFYRPAGLG